MTPKMGHISDRATFVALGQTRTRVRRGPLWVAWVPAPDGDDRVRAAYTIGSRVGGAVVRNRLRRRLRVILADAPLPPGAYLVGAGPEATTLCSNDLKALVNHALQALPCSPKDPR